jgi:hypothetical protein
MTPLGRRSAGGEDDDPVFVVSQQGLIDARGVGDDRSGSLPELGERSSRSRTPAVTTRRC